jgi:hypothetical protein
MLKRSNKLFCVVEVAIFAPLKMRVVMEEQEIIETKKTLKFFEKRFAVKKEFVSLQSQLMERKKDC